MKETIEGGAAFHGTFTVPGDKSSTHRALLLGALASGTTRIHNPSPGDDVARTATIVEQLGAVVRKDFDQWTVIGPSDGLRAAASDLDCGNSGTTMRLLCGVLGGVRGEHVVIGDESLTSRPMDRIAEPLGRMGVTVTGHGDRCQPPLGVHSEGRTTPLDYDVPVASAQVKSAILLAGLFADGPTEVREAVRTRPTTERMLLDAGIDVTVDETGVGRRVVVSPGRPTPHNWAIPSDPSQAAFFLVAALLGRESDVVAMNLDPTPERLGYLTVLGRMHASLGRAEGLGVIAVSAKASSLLATTVAASEIPSLDEVPILAVAAAAATGTTRFTDVGELRVKESDRLAATARLVNLIGARATIEGDDLVIEGLGAPRFREFSVHCRHDHRMGMAAAVAAAVGRGGTIQGAETVATSFPDFFAVLESLR